jgi:hypothetical protein
MAGPRKGPARTRLARLACLPAALALAPLAHVRVAQAAPPWVDRALTLPAGDWSFDVGLGVGQVPGNPNDTGDTGAGVNAEMAVGLTNRVELGLRTGIRFDDEFERSINADDYGRLFDRQTLGPDVEGDAVLANPEVRVRGALVREPIVEVALEGRFVVPFADGSNAGALFGMPLAFHLGPRVRLDVGLYVPIAFLPHDAVVGLHVPIDVWIQATRRLWLGPMTGVAIDQVGRDDSSSNVSLGMGLGYAITYYLDFKAMLLFPTLNNDSRVFGGGAGIQVRIE